jgi:hypothetical protein
VNKTTAQSNYRAVLGDDTKDYTSCGEMGTLILRKSSEREKRDAATFSWDEQKKWQCAEIRPGGVALHLSYPPIELSGLLARVCAHSPKLRRGRARTNLSRTACITEM